MLSTVANGSGCLYPGNRKIVLAPRFDQQLSRYTYFKKESVHLLRVACYHVIEEDDIYGYSQDPFRPSR